MTTEQWRENITHDINYLKAHAEQTDITFGCYMRMINKISDDQQKLAMLLHDLDNKLNQLMIREGML